MMPSSRKSRRNPPLTFERANTDINSDKQTIQKYPTGNRSANLKVMARFRPINEFEEELQVNNLGYICYESKDDYSVNLKNDNGNSSNFIFDRVFSHNAKQDDIYSFIGEETLNDVLAGYNGTIFTYGQSGSGKTHTLYGSDIYDEETRGLIPRIVYILINIVMICLKK
jgi:kinesin family protein 5